MKITILTRSQQRAKTSRQLANAVSLELNLRDLVRKTLNGSLESATEFQQLIQFAPPEMHGRIADYMEAQRSECLELYEK